MSEPNTSVWKSFFWIMLLALIGVYALYHHYTGSLHSDLDRTIAELGQVSRTLKTTDGKLYPMENSNSVQAMKKDRSKKYEVTARVAKQGGTKYLDVTYVDAM